MKGPPISSKKACAITLLAAAAAWALWFTNHVVYRYAVWKYQDCYRLTQAVVDSVEATGGGKRGTSYWADVTVDGKPERMNLVGFGEFDQSLIKHGTAAQYTGRSVPVYYCSSAPVSLSFTNRGLNLIPADTDLTQAGRRVVTSACAAYLPPILSLAFIFFARRMKSGSRSRPS